MSAPLWAVELADEFWCEAGGDEPFPRSLRRPIARTFRLPIIPLPGLGIGNLKDWLADRGIALDLRGADRPLRGCLVVRRGHGFLFVDKDDPEEEQRFSVAHELAHYLRHYWQPHRAAAARLGPAIREVLDGERPPNSKERLHALLRKVPLGFHAHLMLRHPAEGRLAGVADSEREADRLAYELLAPAAAVRNDFGGKAPAPAAAADLLCRKYGLPPTQASHYASLLFAAPPADPLVVRLRVAKKLSNFDPLAGK